MQEQTLGRRIQEARKAAGLSQESLGERLGVSRQAVSKWEADAAVPELENLIAMSRIFGVTIGALLGVEPAAEEPTEEDSPEAPGGESGDAAPDRELTDRELAAVEAIVQKYLEAVRRPRWSRRKKLAAVAGACAAVLLIVLILNGIFSSLGRRLDQVQDQVNYVQSSVSSQIGSLTGQLSGLLEEQTSLISDYQLQVTDYDLEEAVWYLTASVTPREYTAGTVTTFTARANTGATASAEAQNNGGVFTAGNWAVPMGEAVGGTEAGAGGAEVLISVAFSDESSTIRTQTLETLYDDLAAYRLDVDGFWNKDWENGAISFGSLDLQITNNTSIPLNLTEVELFLFPDGDVEPVWSAPLTAAVDLWKEQGYVQIFVPAGPREPVPVAPGQALVGAVRISDDHGQVFWHLLGGWNNQGTHYIDHPDRLNGQDPDWQPGEPLLLWSGSS